MRFLDVEALVDGSAVVALVEVERVDTVEGRARLTTFIDVRVTEGLRGAQPGATLRVRLPGGQTETVVGYVAGVPRPQVGERALVLLENAGGGYFVPTGLGQGWWTLVEGAAQERLVRRAIDATLVVPDTDGGGWVAVPTPAEFELFAPLLERVRSRVFSR